jgi:malate synthase
VGPNQINRKLVDFKVNADDLIAPSEGTITEAGVAKNIRVAAQYLSAWLSGNGCVPIDNLMEDAATAEIGRTQLWQWVKQGAQLDDGQQITQDWLDGVFGEVKELLVSSAPGSAKQAVTEAMDLLQQMTRNPELDEFLTLPAYEQLND